MIETFNKEEVVNGTKVVKTYAKIESLKPDPQNPRDISEEKMDDLISFLTKYPALKPVLVDVRAEKEGQLIGGNQRLKAFKRIGTQEIWIEPREPKSDAEAFEMGVLDNDSFGFYLEDDIKALAIQYEAELELAKLNIETQSENLDELIKAKNIKKMKYEIIIRCIDENDLMSKMLKLNELGINAKKRGK